MLSTRDKKDQSKDSFQCPHGYLRVRLRRSGLGSELSPVNMRIESLDNEEPDDRILRVRSPCD
jgi:hypothetical protein